ncbi:hypothetical protein [Agarivorans sp. QJM3NY_25]|uniref:hypothetical protein n=1 Tax=Agarivorans sp. QJM3NY_25 TaxID=3421430 RepID=UPI003D7C610D
MRGFRLRFWAGAFFLALLSGSLLFDAYILLKDGMLALAYPYELDYGEGPILSQTILLGQGLNIYHDFSQAPYTVANYPPVFHYFSLALTPFVGSFLQAGRLVSFMSTWGAAAVIACCVFSLSNNLDISKKTRLFVAMLSGAAFLGLDYVYMWAALMRVDMLALLLTLCGLAWFIWRYPKQDGLWGAILWFCLAAFTKQSTLAAPMAVALYLLLKSRQDGFRFSIAIGILGASGLALLVWNSEGGAWQNLVIANKNNFYWSDVAKYLGLMVRDNWLYLVASLLLLTFWLYRALRSQLDPRILLIIIYLGIAFLTALSIGKVGSNFNYYIEFLALACIAFGLVLLIIIRQSQLIASKAGLVVMLMFAVAVTTFHSLKYHGQFKASYRSLKVAMGERNIRNEVAHQQQLDRVVDWLRSRTGEVISEDMTLLSVAGQPLSFQPFIMTQLAGQGLWDPSPVVESLLDRRYAGAVLLFDLDNVPAYAKARFSSDILNALKSRYQLRETFAQYHLYEPLSVSVPQHFIFYSRATKPALGPLKKPLLLAGLHDWNQASRMDYQGDNCYAMVLSLTLGHYDFQFKDIQTSDIRLASSQLRQQGKKLSFDIPVAGVYTLLLEVADDAAFTLSLEPSHHLILNYFEVDHWERELVPLDRETTGMQVWYLAPFQQTFFSEKEALEFLRLHSRA